MPAVTDLPPEVLVVAFSFLDRNDLRNLENVCVSWRKIVMLYFWNSHINLLTKHNTKLRSHLESLNWTSFNRDCNVISKVWRKLNHSPGWEKEPFTVEKSLYCYSPGESRMKVSNCVLYKDKIFVSMVGGNVHSRSLDDFRVLKVLHGHPENYNLEEPLLQSTPIALSGDILAVPVKDEDEVYLWNAETEERVGVAKMHRNRANKIYDIKMSPTHIICLASWSLITWRYELKSDQVQILYGPSTTFDFYDKPTTETVNIWFETHNLEMNEDFVVTHASQPLLTVFRSPHVGPKTRSFLHCRRFVSDDKMLGKCAKLNEDVVTNMEIGSISLSSKVYNILAISMVDETVSFRYVVKLMKIPTGEILNNVFPTKLRLSEVRIPIAWVDNNLVMKLAPKLSVIDDVCDQDVILSLWNYERQEEVYLDHVQMVSFGDHILIDHAHVIQIFHRFARHTLQENEENILNEICARSYDYWSNK